MTLCVSSENSLEDLEKWVREKFSDVVNKDVTIPDLGSPPPWTPENSMKLVKFVPVKDLDQIKLIWNLPYYQDDIYEFNLNYYSHLIGHEGENSVLSYLKDEGLALTLGASGHNMLWSFSRFEVTVKLTKKGLENYEKVVEAVMKYVQKLRDIGPQDYVF